MNVLSFAEAIAASSGYSKRHLLLGNGFSIACRPDIFRYDKLFEQADFSVLPDSVKSALFTDIMNKVMGEESAKAWSYAGFITTPNITYMLSFSNGMEH